MYAIFESGGKQYKATAGNFVDIEKMDIPVGESFEITNILMLVDEDQVKIGTPTVEDTALVCRVLDYVPGKKLIVFKSKRRKGYSRKIGHRQKYMRVQVDEIRVGAKADQEAKIEDSLPESDEGGNS